MLLERVATVDMQRDAVPTDISPPTEAPAVVLGQEILRALQAWEGLTRDEAAIALQTIEELRLLRSLIHDFAHRLGQTRACEAALPYCVGECCKLHFPRDISRVDLFVAICGRAGEEVRSLSARIASSGQRPAGCPLLDEHGCVFSFQDRPIVCASAYPCFATREYWEFLQAQKPRSQVLHERLQNLPGVATVVSENHGCQATAHHP
jgi:hypothetical protein